MSSLPQRNFGLPSEYAKPEPDAQLLAELTDEFNRSVSGVSIESHVPFDASNQVQTLAPLMVNGQLTLVWQMAHAGDYNQDGEVTGQDITPMAMYWQQTPASEQWPAARLADGNGDGEVSMQDLVTIAQNYQSHIDGYVVYRDGAELARVALADAPFTAAGARFFDYVVPENIAAAVHTYTVAPYMTGAGEGIVSVEAVVGGGRNTCAYPTGTVKTTEVVIDDTSYTVVADEVLLVLDEPTDLASVIALVTDGLQGELAGQVAGTNTYRVRLSERYQNAAKVSASHLSSAALGYRVEYNTVLTPCAIPAEPRQDEQWNLDMLRVPEVWEGAQGQSIAVGVIDTGVFKHSEFSSRLSNGFSTRGGDTNDEAGHGTTIAGLIAAGLNESGIAGCAPLAEIVPVKAGGWSEDGGWQFTAAELAEALDWAIHEGDCKVVNFSLGSLGSLGTAFEEKLAEAEELGVVVIGAAGNNGIEAPFYPAAYDTVLSVGAVDASGARASYSSFGSQWVDCCAPGGVGGNEGEGILATSITAEGYGWYAGTSLACAQASAIAALALEAKPEITPALLRAHLIATGLPAPLAPGMGPLLNAQEAITRLGEGQLVTGVVTSKDGLVVPGVHITLDGPVHQEVRTNVDGVFSFSGCFPGVYKLMPAKLGYTFDPQEIDTTVADANVSGLLFTALPLEGECYSISGQVLLDGAPLPGVVLSLGTLAQETTDSQGRFTITGVPAGHYGIEPRLAGYSFDPPFFEFDLNADITGVLFNAAPAAINPAAGNVSGRVTTGAGTGVDGVTISMPAYPDTTTAGGGYYSFIGAADGPYTVTPTLAGQTFTPANRSITVSGGPVANVDFTLDTYSLSGYVRYLAAAPYASAGVSGAIVNLSGAASASTSTNGAGYYSFTYLWAGNYTVTPGADPEFAYAPGSSNQTLGPTASNVNFTATPQGSISGTVTRAGAGYNGVTINVTGPWSFSTTTAGGGLYTISNVADGNYTITPSFSLPPGQSFTPANRSITVVNGSAHPAQDFAFNLYSLSGTITLPAAAPHNSDPLSGVTVDLTGGLTDTQTSDAAGVYAFTNIWTYNGWTITPSHANFTFSPANRTRNTPPSNAAQNFTATPRGSISGTVAWPGHGSLPGVTITATGQGGAPNYTYAAGTSGAYTITPVFPDTYNLVPSLGGQTFTPASRAPVVTNAAVTNQDFTVDVYIFACTVNLPAAAPYSSDPIAAISFDLTGSETGTTVSDIAGSFKFIDLLAGSYTVTPTPTASYSFSPGSIAKTVGPDTSGNAFIATPNGSVSGTVTWPGHGGLNGVSVSMTGVNHGYTFSTTTSGAGNYSFTNVIDDVYNMTVTYGTNTFTPSASPYTFTLSNGSALTRNFTINTYSISGQVTRACQGHSGVTVDLTGAEALTTTTSGTGYYSFTNLLNGNYTVTPSLANFTFDPASRAVTIANGSATGRNFYSLYDATHTMTVNVVLADGRNVQFIRVTPTGTNPHSGFTTGSPASQVTDINGQVVFAGLQDACNYSLALSVEPPINPLAFSFPINPTVVSTVISDRTVTITIIKNWFDVEGFVTDTGNNGVNGVTIDLTGLETRSTTTSTDPDTGRNGWYQFLSLDNGLYWVTPASAGNGFVPSEREVNINEGDMPEQNYVLHAGLFSASGTISQPDGLPLAGVTITMHSQTAPLTATSAADGTYSVTNIPYGSHLFTPQLAGWWFTPAGHTVDITGNASGVNFVGHQSSAGGGVGTVSGFCLRPNGTGIAGATVTLSGFGVPRQASTNGIGFYLFESVPNYANYTLTPVRAGFTFTPTSLNPVTVSNNHLVVADCVGD